MATVNFIQQANMSTATVWYGYVTIANATTLSITNYAGRTGTYYGNGFNYDATSVTGGTVTGYVQYENYSQAYTVSGTSAPATRVAAYINSGNEQGLQEYILQGGDYIFGSSYSDVLLGYSGNDSINGGSASDWLNGGDGIDVSVYYGQSDSYSVSITGSSQARVTDAYSADTLVNIERLQFTDTMLAIDIGAGQHGGEAFRLYKAAFDRTPDVSGLGYWIYQLDNGASLNSVSQSFINSAEFQQTYGPNLTNNQFITLLYNNVLDRAPDAGGLEYWNYQMNHGMERASVLANFSESTENINNTLPLIANGADYQLWLG